MDELQFLGMIVSVIVTLVGTLTVLVKWMIRHFDKQSKIHQVERGEWRRHAAKQMRHHRIERREWREAIESNSCKFTNLS